MADRESLEKEDDESLKKEARKIIDAIQRADEDDGELKKELEEPINNGAIPKYFKYFIEKTQEDLKNTINSCVKSRNKLDSRDDLKKYSEGYFNEIIQNANDAICNIGVNNPIVEIKCKKTSNNKYFVECSYPDSGFSLENIYGFCTRGNSNKNSEKGQEGMYGIGIKSLFCFIDELCIESNIIIKISSREKLLGECEIKINDNDFENKTTLKFSFTYDKDNLEKNKHAGFNVKKLASFIDDLYTQNINDYSKYFLTGKDDEIVFDVRSLFFTELRGNRAINNSIKEVIIKREDEEILVLKSNEEVFNYDNNYNCIVKKVKAYINDDECEKYVLLHFKNEDISLAFEYNKKEEKNEKNDRLYSTYYVGENEKGYLGIKTGCLINTKEINSSRSGLEHKNEKEPEVLNTILKKGQDAVRIFCKLATNDQNVIDVLCNLLYLYREQFCSNNENLVLYYIFDFDECIKVLGESICKWDFGNSIKYILKEEDGVERENEIIVKNKPSISDDENVKDLFKLYEERIILNNNKHDLIIYNDKNYEKLSNGVKLLAKFLFEELNKMNEEGNHSWIEAIDGLPFLYGIKDLLKVRIGGDNSNRIFEYLNNLNDDEKKLVKQLISRYKLNDCFDAMGNYTSANVAEWLFDSIIEDFEKYKDYENLKEYIKNKKTIINYYFSNIWCAYADGWKEECQSIIDNDKFKDEKLVLQILYLISKNILYVGYDGYSGKQILYRINKGPFLSFYNRQRRTTSWNGQMSFIYLDLIDKEMTNFDNFKIARQYIDEYNDSVNNIGNGKRYYYSISLYKLNIIKSCNLGNIEFEKMNDIFKWLAEYDLQRFYNSNIFMINNITYNDKGDDGSDLIKFVNKMIKDVKINITAINVKNNGKKFIGYVTNIEKTGMFIRKSADEGFKQVGKFGDNIIDECEKFIFIFYSSSCENKQKVMSDVLKDMGYGDEYCSYVENYINCGNVSNLPSSLFNIYLKKDRLGYEYPFEVYDVETKDIEFGIGIDDIYDILSSEMSYDNHCPFCNQIPTLNVIKPSDGIKEYTKKTKRNSLIIMMNAEYNEKNIYLKLLCCKSCFNQLKDTLTEATVEDVENEKYKKLILKSRIVTSCRERDLETVIKISPDNWEIIRSFNKID